jgi:hypothetical protein
MPGHPQRLAIKSLPEIFEQIFALHQHEERDMQIECKGLESLSLYQNGGISLWEV